MPVHIGELVSEVDAVEGELQLSPRQIEQLIALLLQHLDEREEERRHQRDSTSISATPLADFADD